MMAIKPQEGGDEVAGDTKTIPLVWIPATLCVGLLIAAIYLGGRILAAHPHPKLATGPSVEQVSAPMPAKQEVPGIHETVPPVVPPSPSAVPQPPALPAQPSAPSSDQPAEPTYDTIQPQPGQRYIQVGALNPEATRRFAEYLRGQKFNPHVAPGPSPELERVLIGPFENLGELYEIKAQLEGRGIPTFVRRY